MVAHTGATVRVDRLRPLNTPRPIRVEADDRGWPVRVGIREARSTSNEGRGAAPSSLPARASRLTPITEVLDRWRIDDEWWRQEVSRMYFQVVLAGGAILDIFHDLLQGGWYLQTAASPMERSGSRDPIPLIRTGSIRQMEKAEPVEVLAPAAQTRTSTRTRQRSA